MPPPVERRAATASLLTIRTKRRTWGLPGAAVTGVELARGHELGSPLDLLELLEGSATPADEFSRVLTLTVGGEQLSLLAHGALTLLEASHYELLALPSQLTSTLPLVTHLAVVGGKPSLLVVSPERLLQAAREKSVAATSSVPDPR